MNVVALAPEAAADELVVPGRVKAHREAVLIAYSAGWLTDLPRAEGARFRRGDALARFEAPEIRGALDAATAAVEAARVRRETALRQEARMDSLYQSRVVAIRDLELARTEARAADAAAGQARSAQAQARSAHTIAAPFDGVVVRRRADVGSRVAPGQPVLEIRSAGGTEIEAAIPESGLELARHGQAWAQAGDGPWLPVRLQRIEGGTDATTRTRIAYFEPAATWSAEPGAFARVRLVSTVAASAGDAPAAHATLHVPARSIVRRGALAGVFVVRDGRALLRWIKPGAAAGERVEVLSGLWPGEHIALDPAGLADGTPVRPTAMAATADAVAAP